MGERAAFPGQIIGAALSNERALQASLKLPVGHFKAASQKMVWECSESESSLGSL